MASRLVNFDYGTSGIAFSIPEVIPMENVTILPATEQPALQNPLKEIAVKLQEPLGTPSLGEIVQTKRVETVCIVISDATRPVPTRVIVPPLLDDLEANGISREKITFLVATGLHRESTPAELERMLGKDIANQYTVINHVAKDDSQLVDLGTSSRGTPIKVNKNYLDADLRILTGYVDPHFFAGFAGGRKSIVPGIAGKDTILANHSANHIASDHARFCILAGNPLHEDALEIAQKVGADFVVNVLINAQHEITAVEAGDLVQVHDKLVEALSCCTIVDFPEPFDIVVCGNGGYPLDLNLYQAVKSMAIGELGVKPKGNIIAVNECSDGVGHAQFRELMNVDLTPSQLYGKIVSGEIICEDQWEIQILARVLSKAFVRFVSTLSPGDMGTLGLIHEKTVEKALLNAWEKEGSQARILILPNGPAILPRVASTLHGP